MGANLNIKISLQDTPSYLKSKEFLAITKSKILPLVNRYLLPDFKLISELVNRKQLTYKFWIENSGNNHTLVKQIIKKRTWLNIASDYKSD